MVEIKTVKTEISKKQKNTGRSIKKMSKKRNYRTLDQIDEEYYRNHPEEIDSYLSIVFEEYAKDGCTPALLSSLRMIARVKGVSTLAKQSGITRNGIQKALSEEAKPGFRHNKHNSSGNGLRHHLTKNGYPCKVNYSH